MSSFLFFHPAATFHRGYGHRFGRGIEQRRNSCDMLFGAFSRLALQLLGGHSDRRIGRRQRNTPGLSEVYRRRFFARAAATHTAEQPRKCRTVIACRCREVSEERCSVLGLLLNMVEPVVEFRKAECPVDLRSGELEAVFREQTPLFAVGRTAILVSHADALFF